MKTTATLLATSLFASLLLVLTSSAVAAASVFIVAGLAAIFGSDYGQSAEPTYTKKSVAVAAKSTTERHPLAA